NILVIQEPHIDFLGWTRASPRWSPLYPPNHRDSPSQTRSVLFISTGISTNSWTQLPVPFSDITAIQIQCGRHKIQIYNI
ncbi:hypothetical protein K439DRAFT_1311920, partial [Ramaria rubella]